MDDTPESEHDAWMARIKAAVRSLRAATGIKVEQAQRHEEGLRDTDLDRPDAEDVASPG